ncbi:MAG: RluA family pseudouridine synthase [Myxococcota bacterium]
MSPPRYRVGEGEDGERLDATVAALAGPSRSQARRWIDEGRVLLNGERAAPSRKVATGDVIDAEPPPAVPSEIVPEAIPLAILYEDDAIVVVDKSADMVVHPAPGNETGTLVHALLHHCGDLAGIGGVERPGIVHRLDRGTSGVLVVAKDDDAHQFLAAQFQDHSIERVYQALVRGTPATDRGRIDAAIARHPRDRKRMTVVSDARGPVRGTAREAQTAWSVLERFPVSRRSWLEIRPETGRTHQIRVHLASVGLPIAGDPVYGRRGRAREEPGLDRPALHARVLAIDHPRTRERMRFEAQPPQDIAERLAALRRRETS